ncbi:MAG TPA: MAPEG family protein [Candidatus Acidoferrum sp.]|nr:MAPEG family protein [Candidatus Acidoferrum sp.]
MSVTPVYAGLLALMFILLSVRVIGMRRAARVALGDGGNPALLRRQRVHGNFAEYVPLALLLMALAELQHLPDWLIHAIGILLLVGRATHAYGVGCEPELPRARVLGMALTFAALGTGAVANLASALLPLPFCSS